VSQLAAVRARLNRQLGRHRAFPNLSLARDVVAAHRAIMLGALEEWHHGWWFRDVYNHRTGQVRPTLRSRIDDSDRSFMKRDQLERARRLLLFWWAR